MALAGVAMAQQPNEEASPGKKKKQGAEQTHATGAKPAEHAAKPHETAPKERGVHTEPPGFVRGGGDDAAAGRARAHDHGTATKLGSVALLDCCVKRVHVDVRDRSTRRLRAAGGAGGGPFRDHASGPPAAPMYDARGCSRSPPAALGRR